MKNFFLIVVFICIITGCVSGPAVHNVSEEFVSELQSGGDFSLEKVEKAIMSACLKRGWSLKVSKPGLIEAKITVRTHRATIEIPYSEKSYSINYKDSYNLDYKNGTIHRNYNKWVMILSGDIKRELGDQVHNN